MTRQVCWQNRPKQGAALTAIVSSETKMHMNTQVTSLVNTDRYAARSFWKYNQIKNLKKKHLLGIWVNISAGITSCVWLAEKKRKLGTARQLLSAMQKESGTSGRHLPHRTQQATTPLHASSFMPHCSSCEYTCQLHTKNHFNGTIPVRWLGDTRKGSNERLSINDHSFCQHQAQAYYSHLPPSNLSV